MLVLDKEEIAHILEHEQGVDSFEARRYADRYMPIHDELAPAVHRWLQDRTVLEVSVGGVSVAQVMAGRPTHFLQAVRLLSRLLDEDIPVHERAARAERLRRPVPRW